VIAWPAHPVLYEINTCAWLSDLSRQSHRPVTLSTVPETELRRLARYGFDGLWLMGVWQRSAEGRRIARAHPQLQEAYRHALPDYVPADLVGSPYAILRYQVDSSLGSDAELDSLRQRLAGHGLRLILDFVPNHLAIDHPWVRLHPDYLVRGSADDLSREPGNYFRTPGQILAHGRDPYFPGWTDTVQVDYRRPAARRAMADLLLEVAGRCDGIRCDMAMLVTHDIFLRTWGGQFIPSGAEFWPATIAEVRYTHPNMLLMAEVYWDMEYQMQQMGFDYAYDKRLYDRLRGDNVILVREHLQLANVDYQRRLVRFLENHDEERAMVAFGAARSRAVATVTLTLPGARLVHDGQMEGRRRRLPVQLGRRMPESAEPGLEPFYRRLLGALRQPVFHDGQWYALEPYEAWAGNPSHRNMLAHAWRMGSERRLAVANLANERGQCFVLLGPLGLESAAGWELVDLLGSARHVRDGRALITRGLYLELPAYGHHLFDIRLKP